MRAVRGSGNISTELRFVSLLRRNKIGGWRRGSLILGRPDFVFVREKLAVFIDGDFWHGHPSRLRLPNTNVSYWRKKIHNNIKRDRRVDRQLRKSGWTVLRVWESSLVNDGVVISRVRSALRRASKKAALHTQTARVSG